MEEILEVFNPHWKKLIEDKTKIRDNYLKEILKNLNKKEIIFLTGIRRIGKTTLIKQTINYLIGDKKINPKKILFISCDNLLFSNKTLFEIIDVYRKINNIKQNDEFYFFIDEITYIKNFNQQLKNLYDTWNMKILTSSSNMSYLNDEKAYLTGRTTTIEVFPLTYQEYLEFRNYEIQKYDKALNKKYFEEYLKYGGIPEYVIKKDPQYLIDVINSIIEKDIIFFYRIKDEKVIKELYKLLCERIGKPTSYNKLSNILKVKPETIKRYITYFEKTYLLFSCERYSKSFNENITSPKKFYVMDLGLKNMISKFEIGNCFENLVFVELYKNRLPMENINYYLENSYEIDFITNKYLIEVKYENSELSKKQQELFDKIKNKKKMIIRNYDDMLSLKNGRDKFLNKL